MYASQSIRLPDIRPLTHAGAARLTVVVLGLAGLACGFPRRCAAQGEDLSGRVVDKAGVAVSGAKVWAIGGDWGKPETVATTTTGERVPSCFRTPGETVAPSLCVSSTWSPASATGGSAG